MATSPVSAEATAPAASVIQATGAVNTATDTTTPSPSPSWGNWDEQEQHLPPEKRMVPKSIGVPAQQPTEPDTTNTAQPANTEDGIARESSWVQAIADPSSAEAKAPGMAGSSSTVRDLMPRPMLPTPRTPPERPPGIEPFTGPSAWTPREFPKMGDESPPVTPIGQPPGSSLHQLIQPPMSPAGKAPPEAVLQRRREAAQEADANAQDADANAQVANADANESEEGSNPWQELN